MTILGISDKPIDLKGQVITGRREYGFLGADDATNNTGELCAMANALLWLLHISPSDLHGSPKAKARPNNSTRGSISMVDMRNRPQPQVPRHSLQQSPWSITGSNVALAPSRDHRCTTVPSPSPATCSDMQYHILQRSCSTASCRLSIHVWMPPTVVSRWATTSGQYLAHATSN